MSVCRVCQTAFPPDDCDGLHVALYGVCMVCAHRIESRPHDPKPLALGGVVCVAAAGLSHSLGGDSPQHEAPPGLSPSCCPTLEAKR